MSIINGTKDGNTIPLLWRSNVHEAILELIQYFMLQEEIYSLPSFNTIFRTNTSTIGEIQ